MQGHDGVAKPLPPPWQTASQYETHLQLGSDHSVPMTTLVRSDFTEKPTVQVWIYVLCSKQGYDIIIYLLFSHFEQCKPRVPEGINEINIAVSKLEIYV